MSGIVLKKTAAADIPTPATDKATVFLEATSGEPSYKDDTGAVSTLVGAAGADGVLSYLDHGNTGATETVDASAGDIQRLVANAATVTLSLAGWPAAGTPAIVRLWLEQDGSGGRDWVFPGSVDFGDAGEPDWTTRTAGEVDIVDLMTVDGGTAVIASVAGRPGPAGSNGTNGLDGSVGGAISIDYTFSTTTTDSDPGSGNLRLSNATQASATTIRADLADAHDVDWTAVLDTLADASNTVKGHIRLFKKSDPTKWLVFTVSAVATPSGYRNITVANVGSSGVDPLTNGDAITLAFSRSGDQGSSVGSGTLTTVEEADGSPTDSAVTKLVFPNGTLGIASHVATYTPATAPFVGCRAYNSGQQAIAHNTYTAVTFDSEEYDTDSIHSTSSNTSRFTVPTGKDGKWRLHAQGYWNNAFASMTLQICYFKKNGTTELRARWREAIYGAGAGFEHSIQQTITVDLAAGDYVEWFVYQNSGVSKDLGGGSTYETILEAEFLG